MLTGKVAVISGGSRGLGRAIAEKFAQNGASLFLVALHEEKLVQAQKEIRKTGAKVEILYADIAEPGTSEQIVEKTLDRFGTIDILVNCAGVITRTLTEELSLVDWHRVIDVNLNGTFYLSKVVLPVLREKKYGKIINISSQMARMAHPSASPSYEVTKAGMEALTRHLACHYAKYNICVNSIAPGSIDTDLPKSMSLEARQRLKDMVPLQRLGEPEEVGALALFLASDQSDYITGARMTITGGSLMD